jgi:hypothetical protein
MDRIQVGFPKPVLNKIRKYAHKNDISMSASVLKLVEFALAIESKKQEKNLKNEQGNEAENLNQNSEISGVINQKINELIIQNAIILKEIIRDGFNFDDKKIDEIKEKVNKARTSILTNNK